MHYNFTSLTEELLKSKKERTDMTLVAWNLTLELFWNTVITSD